MAFIHKNMAGGRWFQLSLAEQLGNIGAEVARVNALALRNQTDAKKNAAERALELLDLTLADARWATKVRELSRLREVFCDWVWGENECGFNPEIYFLPFASAGRNHLYR